MPSSKKKRTTLRDSLKELEDPAFDVSFNEQEDEDVITSAKIENNVDNDEDAQEDENTKIFGNLRKKAYVNQHEFDAKYFGSKTSRKALKQWEIKDSGKNLDQELSGDEESIEDDEDNIDDDEIDEVDDDEEEEYDDDEDESGGDDDEGDLNDQYHSNEEDNAMDVDLSELPDDLKKGLASIKSVASKTDCRNDEDDDDFAHFTEIKIEKEIEKGKATKSQIELLDKLLETRIRLQKSLQLSNRFPQHDVLNDFKQNASSKSRADYNAVKLSMKELLQKLLELQDFLLTNNEDTKSLLHGVEVKVVKKNDVDDEEIPSDTDEEEEEEKNEDEEEEEIKNKLNLPSKRKHTLTMADFEEEISKRSTVYLPYQENIINKWYDKTRLASTKLNNKGFAGFEKSTVQQIKQVLSDKPRLIKRSQLRRTPYDIIGKKKREDDEVKFQVEDLHLKDYDEHIFDDGDFYHEMLKELIERKSHVNTSDPVSAGRQWLELQKLRTKIKRKIDTRASKGRKVRYDVHSKLVSFMAPQNIGSLSDQGRNELYSSLFGGFLSRPITQQ